MDCFFADCTRPSSTDPRPLSIKKIDPRTRKREKSAERPDQSSIFRRRRLRFTRSLPTTKIRRRRDRRIQKVLLFSTSVEGSGRPMFVCRQGIASQRRWTRRCVSPMDYRFKRSFPRETATRDADASTCEIGRSVGAHLHGMGKGIGCLCVGNGNATLCLSRKTSPCRKRFVDRCAIHGALLHL